jgi:cytochrome P450
MSSAFLTFLIAASVIIAPLLYTRLRYKRIRQYAHFPQVQTSLILGHLKKIDDYIKAGKPNGHPDLAFVAMNEALGRPPLMLVDLRPVGPAMVIVRSHEVAEQVSRATKLLPHSLPKMPQVYEHMSHITGPSSILALAGEEWRLLRKRFNPGFASQHLLTFLPCILDQSLKFLDNLDKLTQSGKAFSLVHITSDLIFDVISSVAMDQDFGAQDSEQPSNFSVTYRDLVETYAREQVDLPWYFTPGTEWERRKLSEKLRKELKLVIENAFIANQRAVKSKSILALSLRDIDELTPQVLEETCDQLSTFLFAGHDTTSILLSWMLYELSRTPHALKAVRTELADVFGPGLQVLPCTLLSTDWHRL